MLQHIHILAGYRGLARALYGIKLEEAELLSAGIPLSKNIIHILTTCQEGHVSLNESSILDKMTQAEWIDYQQIRVSVIILRIGVLVGLIQTQEGR